MARATWAGALALALWATLAWLTTRTARLPAFELMALALAPPALAGALLSWRTHGHPLRFLALPARRWALGLFGIFGYHALFFTALRTAPAAEANLLNYLWPVLLALLSARATGHPLRGRHWAGLGLGFAGAAVVASGGAGFHFDAQAWGGYAAALGCAVVWPLYSVASQKEGGVPSLAVLAFCAGAAALAAALHLVLEPFVAPTPGEWAAVAAMGLGPLGAALFAWDVAMKRGRVRLLASASFFEPLFSTLVLAAAGAATLGWTVWAGCGLVVAGALASGWDPAVDQR